MNLPHGAAQGTEFSYRLSRSIYPAFRLLFPNQAIWADDLARVMVDIAVQGKRQARRTNLGEL